MKFITSHPRQKRSQRKKRSFSRIMVYIPLCVSSVPENLNSPTPLFGDREREKRGKTRKKRFLFMIHSIRSRMWGGYITPMRLMEKAERKCIGCSS